MQPILRPRITEIKTGGYRSALLLRGAVLAGRALTGAGLPTLQATDIRPPRCHMISAATSVSRQPLRGRFASLDTSVAAKEQQLRGGMEGTWMTHPQPAPHPPLPIQQALPPTGRDHRAIGVSLTTVKSGAGRPSPGTQVGRSDVMTACSAQIPKLTVRSGGNHGRARVAACRSNHYVQPGLRRSVPASRP